MNDLISVILPVYNGGKYLSSAIQSILNQTYGNLEIIIINDGSKDNSIDIINELAKKDQRIKVVDRENQGLIYSLNEAILISKGYYIARMDQDDISEIDRIEIQYKYMLENNIDICGGNFSIIDENDIHIGDSKVVEKKYEILLVMASNVPFAHPSVMIKKTFLENNSLKYGTNGDRNAEDMDLWLNMYRKKAIFGNVNKTILKYRILSTSMSRVNALKIKKEKEYQLNTFMKEYKSEYEDAFNSFFRFNSSVEVYLPMVRATLRYALIYNNYIYYFRCLKRMSIITFIKATLSFIKQKTIW